MPVAVNQWGMVDFVVIALATWRLTSLIHAEWPMGWFRKLVGVVEDDQGPVGYTNIIGKVVSCVWCLSFWTGQVAVLIYLIFPIAAWVLAASAAAIIVHSVIEFMGEVLQPEGRLPYG